MTFTQQQFLGASIRYFNVNLGWGNQESVLEVGLVEDDKLDEHFDPVLPGYLVRFQYDTFVFDGIISNYNIKRGQAGNRVIDVTITDPRRILEGVQLILNGYNDGVYGVKNIYNVFGYLENIGYGYAGNNNLGIPAYKIVQAMKAMLPADPVVFQGVSYLFNMENLPPISPNYRVCGDNMSFLDFINDICETANCDYFIKAVGSTLVLYWISRNQPYQIGAIDRFIQTLNEYPVDICQGLSLESNTSTRFMIGPQVEEVFFQSQSGLDDDPLDKITPTEFEQGKYFTESANNAIWPYWGLDANNNAVLGRGFPRAYIDKLNTQRYTDHYFILDGRSIKYPFIDFSDGYKSSVAEMRAAAMGMEEWNTFLSSTSNDPKVSFHAGKLARLTLPTKIKADFIKLLFTNPAQAKQRLAKDLVGLTLQDFIDIDSSSLDIKSRVFAFISEFATQYYGRKFLVAVPDLLSKIDADTLELQTSLEPTQSGYMSEEQEDEAVSNGLMPSFKDFVKDPDGKIVAYVRFDGWQTQSMDIGSLSSDDFIIDGNYVFVKCEVDPKIVFLDRANLLYPRAVITLPGIVYAAKLNENTKTFDIIGTNYKAATNLDPPIFREAIIGENISNAKLNPPALAPSMVAIPMRDNYRTYGPWYGSLGTAGSVELDKNEELNPWNFGGFAQLNKAATSMVNEISVNQFYGETGSVTIPGTPSLDIGAQLTTGGPYISSVQVGFDPDGGVTTTYLMQKWATKLGKQNRQNIESYKKYYKLHVEQKRLTNKLYQSNPPLRTYSTQKGVNLIQDALRQPKTPHHLICAEIVDQDGGKVTSVATVSLNEVKLYLDSGNMDRKAGCSWDAIFFPFTNDSGNTILPKTIVSTYTNAIASDTNDDYMQTASNTGLFISGKGLDVGIIFHGQSGQLSTSSGTSTIASGDYSVTSFNNNFLESGKYLSGHLIRSVGLRFPIYVSNNNSSGTFSKSPVSGNNNVAGPLDLRFNTVRGVWTCDEAITGYGTIISDISGGYVGSGFLYCTNLDQEVSLSGFLSGYAVGSGQKTSDYLMKTKIPIVVGNPDADTAIATSSMQFVKLGGIWVINYVYC